MSPLMLYYDEGDSDRLMPYDRYPRAMLRRVLRGAPQVSGMKRSYLNLKDGLDRIGVKYTTNRYRILTRSVNVGCVIGKPQILARIPSDAPIVFGPAVYNHPSDAPRLFSDHNILQIIVSCDWMKQMYDSIWPGKSSIWAAGIDSKLWSPQRRRGDRDIDVLIYNKIMWKKEHFAAELVQPIQRVLDRLGLATKKLTYGSYKEEDFRALLMRSRSMVFLCEHETQGFALLQTLSSDVPVFAWDRGGFWQDEAYFPNRVRFQPVTSTPYWDERCGMKFTSSAEFESDFGAFWDAVQGERFSPRDYIIEHFDLAERAKSYVRLIERFRN